MSTELALAVSVYGFVAFGVNLILLTSVFAEIETPGVFERAKVAVSVEALGRVIGHPIGSGIPVARAGVGEVPCRAGRLGVPRVAKHQN